MKRIMLTFVIIMMLVASATTVLADTSIMKVNTADGTVDINLESTDYSNFKAIVEKGDVEYIYNLVSKNETLPLQMGSGVYTIIF
jgi:hypothetical protein